VVFLARLFLEEIFKCSPGIIRPQRRWSGRLFFSGHTNFIHQTVVPQIFFCNAFLHRLHAFETAAGIEIRALFARMQLKTTLGTLFWFTLQHSSTLRAAGDCPGSRHIHRTRSEREISTRRRRPACTRPLPGSLSLVVAIAILISVLTVFSHNASPSSIFILSLFDHPRQLHCRATSPHCHGERLLIYYISRQRYWLEKWMRQPKSF
jgi:hypothetical protein